MIPSFQQLRWAQGGCEPRSIDLACSVAPMLSRSRIWFSRGRPLLGLDVGRTIAAERGGVQHSMVVLCKLCLVGSSDGLVQCSEALVISQRGMESYRRGLRRLLSAVHVNSKTKLLWECATGHQWDSCLNHVKNHNTWCPVCARTAWLSLSLAQQHAADLGGLCLSVIYVNSRTPLLWECEAGHRWTATFGAVRHKHTWCLECAHERCCFPRRHLPLCSLQEHALAIVVGVWVRG